MAAVGINKHNVGRIAERIVSNELEYYGFRVSELNKEGTSANADLLAAKDGKTWQIQVKGATEENGWWVNYGFGAQEIIDKRRPMYNAADSFYKAQVVVLVCVKSAAEDLCVVLPVAQAERAAQLNLDHSYRNGKKDGSAKKPGKVYVSIRYIPTPKDPARLPALKEEQAILEKYIGNWEIEKFPHIMVGMTSGDAIAFGNRDFGAEVVQRYPEFSRGPGVFRKR
jgi:hypothetical protein